MFDVLFLPEEGIEIVSDGDEAIKPFQGVRFAVSCPGALPRALLFLPFRRYQSEFQAGLVSSQTNPSFRRDQSRVCYNGEGV